jgi:DNA-binding CsgD family transcriptional regulator
MHLATNVLELRRPQRHIAPDRLEDAVRIRDRREIHSAALALESAARCLGLRILAWHDLATLEPMVDADGQPLDSGAFGWDEAELAAWRNFDRALRSPLLRAARVAGEPVWINRHGIHASLRDRALEQVTLDDFEEFSPFGAAIVVPVHLPFGQIGAAILVSNDPGRTNLAAEFARVEETLAPAIARFVAGYVAVSRDERYLPADSLLTSREIECLSWVAHGKTDFEISIILGCSHAGVRYHVTRACAKLGAVNRAQSVFRACQLGYLGPAAARPARQG